MDVTYLVGILLFLIGFSIGAREAEQGLSLSEFKIFFRLLSQKIKGRLRKAR